MKPFALDTVLKFRDQLETQSKNELAHARKQRESIEMLMKTATEEYNNLLIEFEQLKTTDISIEKLIHMEARISFSKTNKDKLKTLLSEKQEKEQKAHALLVRRSKEKKVLEKLKETQNAQWRQYLNKKEAAMLDEIAILRHNSH